jgi:capsid protein
VAARGAAANMGLIIDDPEAEGDGIDPDTPGSIPEEAEPGAFHRLPPGTKLQQYSPEHPVSAFGAFVSAICDRSRPAWACRIPRSPEISPTRITDPCATVR